MFGYWLELFGFFNGLINTQVGLPWSNDYCAFNKGGYTIFGQSFICHIIFNSNKRLFDYDQWQS